jgi:hypothetical protein
MAIRRRRIGFLRGPAVFDDEVGAERGFDLLMTFSFDVY